MSTPAIIYLVLVVMHVIGLGTMHGKTKTYNAPMELAWTAGLVALLYWGGFFS